jgi:hypothetical protein
MAEIERIEHLAVVEAELMDAELLRDSWSTPNWSTTPTSSSLLELTPPPFWWPERCATAPKWLPVGFEASLRGRRG